jgi:hypothetical protein
MQCVQHVLLKATNIFSEVKKAHKWRIMKGPRFWSNTRSLLPRKAYAKKLRIWWRNREDNARKHGDEAGHDRVEDCIDCIDVVCGVVREGRAQLTHQLNNKLNNLKQTFV